MAIGWTFRRNPLKEGGNIVFYSRSSLGHSSLEWTLCHSVRPEGSFSRFALHFFPVYPLCYISEWESKSGLPNKLTSVANWKQLLMATRGGVEKDSGTVSHLTGNSVVHLWCLFLSAHFSLFSISEPLVLFLASSFPWCYPNNVSTTTL